jgi:uncharacterized protein DUF6484
MSTKLEIVEASESAACADEQRRDDASDLMANILARNIGGRESGAVLGVLVGFGASGRPLVSFPADGGSQVVEARSCVTVGTDRIGREVLLVFADGESKAAVITGIIQDDLDARIGTRSTEPGQVPVHGVEADGERLVITAEREIVLRCGPASITLTRDGKLLLRGAYVSTRSAGVNRIKGGSVEIN